MHACIHTLLFPALPACAIRQIPKSPPDYTGLFLLGIVFFSYFMFVMHLFFPCARLLVRTLYVYSILLHMYEFPGCQNLSVYIIFVIRYQSCRFPFHE